jgi:hypothetical protein
MATYDWMDELTTYKQQADTVLVTGREAYDVVVRGTQLINMANKALGTIEGMEGQINTALGVFDTAGAALESITGYINFAIEYLDTIVSEITSLVETMVQEVINEVFEQIDDLYNSVLDSIEEAIDVDVAALMALAPIAGQLFDQALSLLPPDMVGDVGDKIGDIRQYLDVCAAFGNFKGLMNTLAMSEVMSQVNEIMAYVDVNTWIPDATKSLLSTRFTGFQNRAYVDETGTTNHTRLLTERLSFSSAQASQVKDKITQNETTFQDLTLGMDPRCQSCVVSNDSEFEVW